MAEESDVFDAELTDEQRDALIEKIAEGVVKRGMETPAVLFLELHRPLSFIGGQALIMGSPFVGPFVGIENVHRVSQLISRRENVDRLIQKIEELSLKRRPRKGG